MGGGRLVVPSDITLLEERYSTGSKSLSFLERMGLLGIPPMYHYQYSKLDRSDFRRILSQSYRWPAHPTAEDIAVVDILKRRQASIHKRVVSQSFMWATVDLGTLLTWMSLRHYDYKTKSIVLPFVAYGGSFVGRWIGDFLTGREVQLIISLVIYPYLRGGNLDELEARLYQDVCRAGKKGDMHAACFNIENAEEQAEPHVDLDTISFGDDSGSLRDVYFEPTHTGYNENAVDWGLLRRGIEFYRALTPQNRYLFSVLPNLRDIERFADVPGLLAGRLFRSEYPRSENPEKMMHVLLDVLHVETIIDLRGAALPLWNGAESLSYATILREFRLFEFDCDANFWVQQNLSLEHMTERDVRKYIQARAPCRILLHLNIKARSVLHLSILQAIAKLFPKASMFNGGSSSNKHGAMMASLLVSGECEELGKSLPYKPIVTSVEHRHIKSTLDLLLWVEFPVLLCSSYEKDRAALLSILVLHILGAREELLIADYCASEACFMGLHPVIHASACIGSARVSPSYSDFVFPDRNLGSTGNENTITHACPCDAKIILNFIRQYYESIDGYLDFIGFNLESRQLLRSRLVLASLSSGLLYKTPPWQPFWTGNPSLLMPKEEKIGLQGTERVLRRSASVERLHRAFTLLELRDSFALEQIGESAAWTAAENRMRTFARMLHGFWRGRIAEGTSTSKELEASSDEENYKKDAGVAPSLDSTYSESKAKRILSRVLEYQEALREVFAAQRVVLIKLADALAQMNASDIAKLLLYRNVHLYADKNRAIKLAAYPDASEVVLSHPELLEVGDIRGPEDVPLALLQHAARVESTTPSSSDHNFTTKPNNFPADVDVRTSVKCCSGPRFLLVDPHSFFHQLRTRHTSSMTPHLLQNSIPKTFADWLLRCWLIDGTELSFENPFAARCDEYFVTPEILSKFIRLEAKKTSRGNVDIRDTEGNGATFFVTPPRSSGGDVEGWHVPANPTVLYSQLSDGGHGTLRYGQTATELVEQEATEVSSNPPEVCDPAFKTESDLPINQRRMIVERVTQSRGTMDERRRTLTSHATTAESLPLPRSTRLSTPLKASFEIRFSPLVPPVNGLQRLIAKRAKKRLWKPLEHFDDTASRDEEDSYTHSHFVASDIIPNETLRSVATESPSEKSGEGASSLTQGHKVRTRLSLALEQTSKRLETQTKRQLGRHWQYRRKQEAQLQQERTQMKRRMRDYAELIAPHSLIEGGAASFDRHNVTLPSFGKRGSGNDMGDGISLHRSMSSVLQFHPSSAGGLPQTLPAQSRTAKVSDGSIIRPHLRAQHEKSGDEQSSVFDSDDERDFILSQTFECCDEIQSNTENALRFLERQFVDMGGYIPSLKRDQQILYYKQSSSVGSDPDLSAWNSKITGGYKHSQGKRFSFASEWKILREQETFFDLARSEIFPSVDAFSDV